MAYISKEIPVGVINGANVTFTTAQNIASIDNVWVDGGIYLGTYNSTANVLTLGDAPTVSLYIDYYSTPPAPPDPVDVPGYISVEQAYNALLRRLKDLSDVPDETFIEWCDFINRFIYRAELGTDPSRFIQESTLAVVAGQSAYPLLDYVTDSNFRSASEWGTGLFQINVQTGLPTDQPLVITNPGSSTQGYYIQGDGETATINITPQPQQSINYMLRYMPTQEKLEFFGDYFTLDTTLQTARTISDEYLLYVVNALAVQYQIWDEQEGAESYADARFVRSLNELLDYIRKQPPVYGLSDFSLTF